MNVHSRPLLNPFSDPELEPAPDSCGMQTTQDYSIESVTTEEGLSDLEKDWNGLSEAAAFPNIFMTFDWVCAWNRRFAGDARHGRRHPSILVLRRNGAVAGILPFIHRTASRFGMAVRKVEFVESESAYNDFVWGSDPAGQAAAVLNYLAQTEDQWDLVDLRSMRETGNVSSLLKSALAHTRLIYRILPEKYCPYLSIDSPWPVMLSKLSPGTRHRLRNQQNRLDRMSAKGLRVRIIEDPQAEPGLIEKLIALESQKRIKGRLVSPFIARFPEVFQFLFGRLGPRGWISVFLMELGDIPLAWLLVFRCGRKLWGYHRAFNPAFSRLSPGTMLDTALIDYGFSHGYEEYDFLYGKESYKLQWNTGSHERFRLVIWNRRWISRARAFMYLDLRTAIYGLLGKRE
jgi:CelD/BcsL family acetyltransferase involved in cellulose biosynthesis